MPVAFNKPAKKPVICIDVDDSPAEAKLPRERQPLPLDRRINLDARIKAECVEILDIEAIQLKQKHTRKHSEQKILRLSASIEEFGFTAPIIVDEHGKVLAGEARLLAAKKVGLSHLPVVRLQHLSPAQKRAFAIADNRLAELGEWDLRVLADELAFLFSDGPEITFDPRITAFDTVEVDQIILGGNGAHDEPDRADRKIPLPAETAVTATGDVWICGKHKLYCGNATHAKTYRDFLAREAVDIVFMDPPFNVPNAGHVTDRAGVREFAMAHGEMSPDEFTAFLASALSLIREKMAAGAVVYICMDWRHLDELSAAARPLFGAMRNLIVWVKTNAGMGSLYRSQHELVAMYAAPGKITNNFGLGGKGRHRTNVWKYPGLSSFGRGRSETLAMHPTVKPVAMVADALRDCSKRSDIVLDAFGGSGTTMIAAQKTGRRARLVEIDPIYCDVTVKRWQDFTGDTARLAETGETFVEVTARRITDANVRGANHG